MVWDSESEKEEFNEKPYSALSDDEGGTHLFGIKHFLIIGGGLLLVIILVVIFFSGKPEPENETGADIKGADIKEVKDDITSRLDRLEAKINYLMSFQERIAGLEEKFIDIERKRQGAGEEQTDLKPESMSQIKSNRRSIREATNRLNLIEQRLNRLENKIQKAYAAPSDRQTAGPSTQETAVYVVKKGDTPYSISRKHNMEVDQLLKLNGLDEPAVIYPGQRLKVPAR